MTFKRREQSALAQSDIGFRAIIVRRRKEGRGRQIGAIFRNFPAALQFAVDNGGRRVNTSKRAIRSQWRGGRRKTVYLLILVVLIAEKEADATETKANPPNESIHRGTLLFPLSNLAFVQQAPFGKRTRIPAQLMNCH